MNWACVFIDFPSIGVEERLARGGWLSLLRALTVTKARDGAHRVFYGQLR